MLDWLCGFSIIGKVTLHLSPGEKTEISEHTDWNELLRAIGYLSSWALGYPRVNIYRDGETDLVAVYFNEKDERAYTIGAVWHGDHYGFIIGAASIYNYLVSRRVSFDKWGDKALNERVLDAISPYPGICFK